MCGYSLLICANCKCIIQYLNSKLDKFPLIFFLYALSLNIMRYCTGFLNHVFIIIVFLRIKVVLKNNGYISENYSVSNGFFLTNQSMIFDKWIFNEICQANKKNTILDNMEILHVVAGFAKMRLNRDIHWGHWTVLSLMPIWFTCIWINNLKQHKNCFGSKLLLNALGTVNRKWGQVTVNANLVKLSNLLNMFCPNIYVKNSVLSFPTC